MQQYLLEVYSKLNLSFTHGDGVWLIDQNSQRYLDLISCMAVAPLGHNHKAIVAAIGAQAAKLIHSSNAVHIPEQAVLAEMLVNIYGQPARVFFNNSGSEAVETLIKLARLYGHSKNINNAKIIVMDKAFHGRSIATLSASDNIAIQQGFEPLLDCFIRVPFNDLAYIENLANSANSKNIVAVLLEPIQGEGGIRIADLDYLKSVRKICSDHNWLMLLDEIQSGLGRTGKFFSYQHANILPDAIAMAKGLANGLPIGACIIQESFAKLFKPKSHGSTFGGNQLVCNAAIATLKELTNNKFLAQVTINSAYFLNQLKQTLANNLHVVAVRGKGLMIGIELDRPCVEISNIALEHKIFLNVTRQCVIRLLPPLIIEKQQIDFAVEQINLIIKQFYN